MKKKIIIIGGGISGLSVLHYLKRMYAPQGDVAIALLEKNPYVGGTAHTQYYPDFIFEEGPNGFLDSKESTLQLVRELGLENELVRANPQAKIRYLSINGRLQKIHPSPWGLLKIPCLSLKDKWRILSEPFIPPTELDDETVYDFAKRRLGENFAKYFIDPMVTGIFGGEADRLILKYTFPRMYELEKDYGSIFKAMVALKKTKKSKEKMVGEPKGTLTSFRKGMSQLVEAIHTQYQSSIKTSQEVQSLRYKEERWFIEMPEREEIADQVFLCTPAYVAAQLLTQQNQRLSKALVATPYAPLAVIGLAYRMTDLSQAPKGFGYLVPSCEYSDVLGVLFCNNIFPDRSREDVSLFRVMMGGTRKRYLLNKSTKELISLACEELKKTLKIERKPYQTVLKIWQKAIPQYDKTYVESLKIINEETTNLRGLFLVANYLGGVSLNDCVANAKTMVEKSFNQKFAESLSVNDVAVGKP